MDELDFESPDIGCPYPPAPRPEGTPPGGGRRAPGGPCFWALDDGARLQFDRAVVVDGIALLSGWHTAGGELAIAGQLRRLDTRRADAALDVREPVKGFVAAVRTDQAGEIPFRFTSPTAALERSVEAVSDAAGVAIVLTEQFSQLHRLLPALLPSRLWRRVILGMIDEFADRTHLGSIDEALWVQGVGAAVRGRVHRESPTARYYLVNETGDWIGIEADESLSDDAEAARTEPDAPPGIPFAAALRFEVDASSRIRLLLCREDGIHPVASVDFEPAPGLTEFVRRLFAHPVAPYRFADRVARHDLALVEERLRLDREALSEVVERRVDHGGTVESPRISVVVPLYGRWDFVEHQLLSFCADPAFGREVELIYVVDDPRIVSPLLAKAAELHSLYPVPFSVIPGRFNRGFAGACNLGAGFARGEVVIFFNSDLFPLRGGWAGEFADALERHPDYGVLGARLLTIDGEVQHQGIQFEHEPCFGIWINQHPGQGLPSAPREGDEEDDVIERPAVSGALMAVRREQFLRLGGFDQGYLIGDFEDSDLCLKYHAEGLRRGLLSGPEFTHLERQSMADIGDDLFRQKVVIWNAVRHHRRWAAAIEQLANQGGTEQ